METKSNQKVTAAARYGTLEATRTTVLNRGRYNSRLTIPGLVPEDGQDENSGFAQPYQSLGARAVNNLAAWLLVSLFPPDQHFFRFKVDEDTASELGAESLSEVTSALSRLAGKVQDYLESSAARPTLMEALLHLIVAGNVLLYIPKDTEGRRKPPRMWRMDQYVVLRNERGDMIEAVIREKVHVSSLSEETIAACKVNYKAEDKNTTKVDLHTHVKREGDQMVWYQEINKNLVPGSEGKAPADSSGWLPLRWKAIPGSDWGRAHVSEYIADLMTLDDLNKAIIQFAAAASRVIHMVDPASMVDVEELEQAESGDYVTGYIDKVNTMQLDKAMDFQVAAEVASRVELRLSHAFMLQSGTVRNAERVTAEEIRAMAEELENVLGGVYTVLSAEFQLPLVRRLIYILEKTDDSFPELPDEIIPTIVTGFEAIGRTHSANKLRAWMGDMVGIYGPGVIQEITDPVEIGRRFGESYGIEDLGSLMKTQEQLQQEREQAAQQQAVQSAAPQIAAGAVDAATSPEME